MIVVFKTTLWSQKALEWNGPLQNRNRPLQKELKISSSIASKSLSTSGFAIVAFIRRNPALHFRFAERTIADREPEAAGMEWNGPLQIGDQDQGNPGLNSKSKSCY